MGTKFHVVNQEPLVCLMSLGPLSILCSQADENRLRGIWMCWVHSEGLSLGSVGKVKSDDYGWCDCPETQL